MRIPGHLQNHNLEKQREYQIRKYPEKGPLFLEEI